MNRVKTAAPAAMIITPIPTKKKNSFLLSIITFSL